MTSADIRQSFLDFFAKHGHTIVPSSSLMPDSPGLLFTNAGMNQFVPIFLGDRQADVSKWAGVKPGKDTRAADTQKCIRAGGKHNDLEDVGYDTYHHTMFEMLGNWSFGDYFKKESLEWGWDLITRVWGMPAKRLFATVYKPQPGDPSAFDQEAYDIWARIFEKAGLDPKVHIVYGNKKDNFWMMGDTGPCGPCSEIHFNLLPSDEETPGRNLVNTGSPRCIEIWNHVFIQFNANADGTFSPLAAKHVDTGMGFERVAGIHATTNGFKDFSRDPSNYNADVFAPLFKKVTELSGKTYLGTVSTKREGLTEQEKTDIAFRVLADHARTVSCAIADGILPGNKARNSVIRRILRRGVLYGHKDLGLKKSFFDQLVPAVVESLGQVFPELAQQQSVIQRAIRSEEEGFRRTLDRGLLQFNLAVGSMRYGSGENRSLFPGAAAFELYATYGFPLDMTELLAAQRGFSVDVVAFNAEMAKHKEISDQTEQEVIVAATEGEATTQQQPTLFVGYVLKESEPYTATVTEVLSGEQGTFLAFDRTPFYAEMGGQLGDSGAAIIAGLRVPIADTVKDKAGRHLHRVDPSFDLAITSFSRGQIAELQVDLTRRRAIQRHHTATHLLHFALRKVLGPHVRQAGSLNAPDRLRFDFAHFEALKPEQIREIEQIVNQRIIDNAEVDAYETEFDKKPEGTLAFFGEKYGKVVRVVDVGGYSRELCGGTHVGTTGEIGLVKVVSEGAIAAGTRRLEAVAGEAAFALVAEHEANLKALSLKLNTSPADAVAKLDSLLAQKAELERKIKAFEQKAAAGIAEDLAKHAVERDGLKFVSAVVTTDNAETLRSLGSQILAKIGEGVVTLGAALGDKASLVAYCSPAAIKAGHQAGKIIGELSGKLGGKGGGKPDFAMGGAKDVGKLADVLKA